jgi:hypothetical protein
MIGRKDALRGSAPCVRLSNSVDLIQLGLVQNLQSVQD